MSRRGRATAFLFLALGAAVLGATIVRGYGSSIVHGYGPLRPVVVLDSDLPGGRQVGPREITAALGVRRVPARFVPSGALVAPQEALGLVPATSLPAGSYLTASQLRPPRRRRAAVAGVGKGRRPVEISVSGADALLVGGPAPAGAR